MAARGRDAPIGGQAVLEGVMMRGIRTWSVAVREPTAEQLASGEREIPTGRIAVHTFPFSSALRRHRLLRLPLVRGVVALGGSMAIGLRALNISANAQIAGPRKLGPRTDGDGTATARGAAVTRSRALPGPAPWSSPSLSRSGCSSSCRSGWSA